MLRKPLLTTEEVAELLKVKEATVRGWIRRGELKGIHISREWRIAVKDLEEFVAAGVRTSAVEPRVASDTDDVQDIEGLPTPLEPRGSRAGDHTAASLPQASVEMHSWETSMTAPDLLVHINGSKEWTESVDVGIRLARYLGGRAHGLLTMGEAARFKALFQGDKALIAERQVEWDSRAEKFEASFQRTLQSNGVEGNWLVGDGHAGELLSLVGRAHDLVVVEQSEPSVDATDWDPAEETVIGSGVPTVIVPNKGEFRVVGQRIVVAWNQSREAALAVHGALPLLQRADRVIVLNGQRKEAFASIKQFPHHDLSAHLRRKGVATEEVSFSPSDEKAGPALLHAARQHGADLLVMGACGRSWFREWVLGGATRHVLRHMDFPVLMAH